MFDTTLVNCGPARWEPFDTNKAKTVGLARLAEFRALLSVPAAAGLAADDLAVVAEHWRSTLWHAYQVGHRLALTDVGVTLEGLLNEARVAFEPEFQRRYDRVIQQALAADIFPLALPHLQRLRTELERLEGWLGASHEDFVARQTQGLTGDPTILAGLAIASCVRNLRDLEAALPTSRRKRKSTSLPPLTDALLEVWELLDGRVLSAKAIRRELHVTNIELKVIRNRIFRIRRTGRTIQRRAGLGYFRPDAPPPGMTESR